MDTSIIEPHKLSITGAEPIPKSKQNINTPMQPNNGYHTNDFTIFLKYIKSYKAGKIEHL